MMNDPEETKARETLRRLADVLAEVPPSDEEARAIVLSLGVDVDAMAERIAARAAAHEAARAGEATPSAEPVPATVRDPNPPAREALPFLARKPNGRLALAAGVLAACAAGATVVIDAAAPAGTARSFEAVGQETASTVHPMEDAPDAAATRATPRRAKPPLRTP